MTRPRALSLAVVLVIVVGTGATPIANAQWIAPPKPAHLFPSLIETEGRPDNPRWIAADLLMDVFGKLRRDYIPVDVAKFISGKEDFIDEINDMGAGAQASSIPCFVNYAISSDGHVFDAPSSLEELLAAATFAVSGYVEDSLGGFWRGFPANVITVKVTEIFKEQPSSDIPAYINVPILVGEVPIGSARICTKTGLWSQAPKPGDEVFLFPTRDLEATHSLLLIDSDGYEIIFHSNDELIVPGRLSESLELDEAQLDARLGPAAFRQSLRALRR